jgi:hypothetical protein
VAAQGHHLSHHSQHGREASVHEFWQQHPSHGDHVSDSEHGFDAIMDRNFGMTKSLFDLPRQHGDDDSEEYGARKRSIVSNTGSEKSAVIATEAPWRRPSQQLGATNDRIDINERQYDEGDDSYDDDFNVDRDDEFNMGSNFFDMIKGALDGSALDALPADHVESSSAAAPRPSHNNDRTLSHRKESESPTFENGHWVKEFMAPAGDIEFWSASAESVVHESKMKNISDSNESHDLDVSADLDEYHDLDDLDESADLESCDLDESVDDDAISATYERAAQHEDDEREYDHVRPDRNSPRDEKTDQEQEPSEELSLEARNRSVHSNRRGSEEPAYEPACMKCLDSDDDKDNGNDTDYEEVDEDEDPTQFLEEIDDIVGSEAAEHLLRDSDAGPPPSKSVIEMKRAKNMSRKLHGSTVGSAVI